MESIDRCKIAALPTQMRPTFLIQYGLTEEKEKCFQRIHAQTDGIIQMVIKMTNIEKYKTIHRDIKYFLHSAYVNFLYLKILGEFSKRHPDTAKTNPVLIHLCNLMKADLCLVIAKLCFEDSPSSSSLKNMKKTLNEIKSEKGEMIITRELSDYTVQHRENVRAMRDKLLAHCDTNRNLDNVEIPELEIIFKEATDYYNELCDPSIDNHTTPFSDNEKRFLTSQSMGFEKLLLEGAL